MKESTKKIILFIIVCSLTIITLFIALRINKKRLDNNLLTSEIKDYLNEINYSELDNFITENPSAIIYVSNSSEESTTTFEKIFIPVIKNYNLENMITFININEQLLMDPFYQNAPQLVFYSNKEVIDMIDCTTLDSKKDIINLFKERGYISD